MTEQTRGQKERRAAERVDTSGKLPSQLALDLDTAVVQISAGGMMVDVPMRLAIGSKHGFTLFIGKEELDVTGIVRNCQTLESDESESIYRVGVEFCDMSESQTEVLNDFVKRKLRT